jgi:hypothetical protein
MTAALGKGDPGADDQQVFDRARDDPAAVLWVRAPRGADEVADPVEPAMAAETAS